MLARTMATLESGARHAPAIAAGYRAADTVGPPRAAGVGVALLADLEGEHEVQLRKPRLAGALACEQHRPARPRGGSDLRREGTEPAHPVVAAAHRMSVRRVPTHERLDRLVHVDPIDAVVVQQGVRDTGVLGAPEGRRHVHSGARLRVEDVVRLLAHPAVL